MIRNKGTQRIACVALVILIVLSILVSAQPAHAQSSQFFDFSVTSHSPTFQGLIANDGVNNYTTSWAGGSGSGWLGETKEIASGAGHTEYRHLTEVKFTPDFPIQSIEVTYNITGPMDSEHAVGWGGIASDGPPVSGNGSGASVDPGDVSVLFTHTFALSDYSGPIDIYSDLGCQDTTACQGPIVSVNVVYDVAPTPTPTATSAFIYCPPTFPTGTPTPTGTYTTNTPNPTPTGTLTATPTPSPTYTITPTGTRPACLPQPPPPPTPKCILLGDETAAFFDFNNSKWIGLPLGPNAPNNPSGSKYGLYLVSGEAYMWLNLNPGTKYIITAKWHLKDLSSDFGTYTGGRFFHVALGKSLYGADIPIPADTIQHSYDVPESNYVSSESAGSSYLYKLDIAPSGASAGPVIIPHLIVDYICVSSSGNGGVGVGGTPKFQQCQSCSFTWMLAPFDLGHLDVFASSLWNSLLKAFGWLWCQIQNLWNCVIVPILWGTWNSINKILTFINYVRAWIGLIIDGFISWVLGNGSVGADWFGAHISNALQYLQNAIRTLANGNPILQAILEAIVIFGILIGIIITIIGAVIHFIVTLVGLVPQVLMSILSGFNASASSIPIWSPVCNDPTAFFYYPCLGIYITDNTVLDGPAYYLFLLLIGFLACIVTIWAIGYVIEGFTKSDA